MLRVAGDVRGNVPVALEAARHPILDLLLERAIDGRAADRRMVHADPVVELLRGESAFRARQGLRDEDPLLRAAASPRREPRRNGSRRHPTSIATPRGYLTSNLICNRLRTILIWRRGGLVRRSIGVALVVLLVACSSPSAPGGRTSVVATTTVLADLAVQVAGPDATVDALAPAGASIEDFAPKPEDAKRIANARVILVNGLALDRWVEPLLRNASKDARIVTLSDDLPRLGVGESANPDINANGNPHYWFDVKYAKVYVERIRDALVTADPTHSAGYQSRATSYLADLDRLDAEIRANVAQIPPARRKLVTSHDAFPYYAAAYGLSVVGFTQPEEGKEPSPAELADLVALVKKEQVPAIFSEAQVSPRLAETLAREAGLKTIVTDLPTDSVGAPPADSYLGMMRVVTDKIVQALR